MALLVAGVLLFALAPALVAAGVRGWIWWTARQEHVDVQIAGIDAPLFRPVVLHGIRVRTPATAVMAVDLEIARAEVRLNFASAFVHTPGRRIRDLALDGVRLDIRKRAVSSPSDTNTDLQGLRKLFADSFRVSRFDVRFQADGTRVDARDVSFSASELESGKLNISELTVAAPLFSKHFENLRGATAWQNQRLTLGAIELSRGIDIDAFTIDFSHVALRRIALEANVDVFGGKMRANLSSESRGGRSIWDVAGTASDISLAQMSQTLGWRSPAAGALRACKFTFRGDAADVTRSTASIWTEVNGFSYAGRAADTIMFGGSLYNRRLHVEQLYVKQQQNQVTLSGDAPLTFRAAEWAKPDLNIELSASINNLDAFAQLLGAHPGEYAGELALEGSMANDERKLRGGLTANGEVQLLDARWPGSSHVTADLSCSGSAVDIAYANVVRDDARLSVWGDIDFVHLPNIRATLFPLERLVDATDAPSGSCVSAIALARDIAPGAPPTDISRIDVRAGLFARDCSISLSSRDPAAPEQQTTRAFQLCPVTKSGAALTLVGAAF